MPPSSKAPARRPRAGGPQNVRSTESAPPGAALRVGSRPPAPARTRPSKTLDVFPNPNPERDYLVHMQVPEFTCLCPLTGQPDFAHLAIDYVPDASCVELKSLKLYVWSFRDEGAFHEAVTNRVLDDLVAAMQPRFIRLTARWGVRGGIFTNIVVEHRRPGWSPTMALPESAFAAESPYR